MSLDPHSVTPLGVARIKQLLVLSTLAIVLTGCGLPAGRDVRAYNACVGRHPHEAALCEGPRQAYEVDTTKRQAGAGSINPQSVGSH
jgi:hypothetical protein